MCFFNSFLLESHSSIKNGVFNIQAEIDVKHLFCKGLRISIFAGEGYLENVTIIGHVSVKNVNGKEISGKAIADDNKLGLADVFDYVNINHNIENTIVFNVHGKKIMFD